MAYADGVRALNPEPEDDGQPQNPTRPNTGTRSKGHFRECLMGEIWSQETWLGWDAMMDNYRMALANTKAPKTVGLLLLHATCTIPAT